MPQTPYWLFFRSLTRSKIVVPYFLQYRDLPRFTPQLPPIPGYPTCCRGRQTIYYSLFHLNIKNYKFCKQTGKTPNKHGNPYTFTQNSDTITETADFCLIVQFLSNRHTISGIQKHEKAGFTNHSGEPLYAQ